MRPFVQLALDLLGGGVPAAPAPAPRAPGTKRQLRLGDAVVPYTLQRARRRSIGFTVGPDGLAVRAPAWVTLAAVDAALQDKAGWILRKLGEQQARRRQQEAARIAWGPGQVRDAVQAWLMRDARRCFTERLDHFAPLLGVRWTQLRLSSARTRWGSARTGGSISLNWRLMHYRPAIIDYVVAHELSHLRVMDHSPRFWSVVESVVPDHAALRRSLRELPAPPWD